MSEAAGITRELARGKFTDEMLAEMRALIGTELRTDACLNNEDATRLAILRFAEGIGDDNPLWTDAAYAARTPHGTLIAPPSFIFACLGSVQVGWRGLGGFHADTKLTFHRTIRVGDKITARVFFDGFDGPERKQLRRTPHQGLPAPGIPQPGRRAGGHLHLLAHARSSARRRKSAPRPAPCRCRTRGRTRRSPPSRSRCWPRRRAERTPRYWDDVNVGDEIDTITKGPIGLTDEIAYIAAGAAPIPRHRRAWRRAAALSAASALGLSRPGDPRSRARLLRSLQRLRRPAPGRAGGLRRRHPAHLLGDPRAHQLDGRHRLSQGADLPVPLARLPLRRRSPRRPRGGQGDRRRRRPRGAPDDVGDATSGTRT